MIEQDYLMRIIKDIAKLLAKLILQKQMASIDISGNKEQTENHFLYKRLVNLVVLAFDTYLNDYPDDYLKECDFTRQEIESGLHDFTKKFGITFYDSISQLLNFNDS